MTTVQIHKVTPPKIKARWVERYALHELKTEFAIPTFQRKASVPHIKQIMEAILANKFYDIVIKYYVDNKGKKQIIDGQQRVEALYMCYQLHHLQHYSIMFLIFEEEFARTVFRRLNMGRALATRDHSRALDDGSSDFFNELQPWLSHDRTPQKPTYVEMLNALTYYKLKSPKTVQVRELDSMINAITKEDIVTMKLFAEACRKVSPVIYKAAVYKAGIYRNVFRLAYENKLKADQMVHLLKLCIASKKLVERAAYRVSEDLLFCYKVINDELLPKVK